MEHSVEDYVGMLVDELRSDDGDPIIETANLVTAISRGTGTNRRHWTVKVDRIHPDYYPSATLDYFANGNSAELYVTLQDGDASDITGYVGEVCVTCRVADQLDQLPAWLAALKAMVSG